MKRLANHHGAYDDTGLAVAVQTGCATAEHVGFGRCGCPEHAGAEVAAPIAALLANHTLLDSLVVQINQIECSLG